MYCNEKKQEMNSGCFSVVRLIAICRIFHSYQKSSFSSLTLKINEWILTSVIIKLQILSIESNFLAQIFYYGFLN